MKGAVIDMGTNTFSLIIFEQEDGMQKIIHTDKALVDLGRGGINQRIIAPDAMKRALLAIDQFVGNALQFRVFPEEIKAYATSAIRDAENSRIFLNEVKSRYPLNINVINGIQEANIVYRAVNRIHDFKEDSSCIMDIGGGSTEFSIIRNNQIETQKSYNIGLSRIAQLFEYSDPLSADDKEKIIRFLNSETKGDFKRMSAQSLIGAAGSFESFFQMVKHNHNYDTYKTHSLPYQQVKIALEQLTNSSLEDRNNNSWIVNYRKRMIHIAALKTQWVLNELQSQKVYYSPASLKEGVMQEFFTEV